MDRLMKFSFAASFIRLGFFRLSGLFFYLLVQYLLIHLLSPQDYTSFVAFNSLSMLLGQVSTAGLDGKLVSNLSLANRLKCTPIVLQSLFEYVPFSSLAVAIFILAANTSLLGSGILAPSPMEILFVIFVCFLQPLLSTLLVLADKSNYFLVSDFINVAPWFLRSFLLFAFSFWRIDAQFPAIYRLNVVFFSYMFSSCVVLFVVFVCCRARLFYVLVSFLSQVFLLLRSPLSFARLFAANFVYLFTGFCASAPMLLAPMTLRATDISPIHLQAFSLAFVMLGVIQACGSQFLLRTAVKRIVLLGRRVSLFLALIRSFSFAGSLFYLYGLLMIFLAAISFVPFFRQFDFIDVKSVRFLLLMSFGLFPSAIVTLWHALFNINRFLVFNVISRLLASVVSISCIAWLALSYGAVGASAGLAASPFITVLSFSLVVSFARGQDLR